MLHIIANWKMNLLREEAKVFLREFLPLLEEPSDKLQGVEIGIAPAFTLIDTVRSEFKSDLVKLGAQNVHWLCSGAHTGEISAPMLQEAGVDFCIVGHSERRQFYGESDELVAKRALASINCDLTAVVCVGESESEFRDAKTAEVVERQLRGSLGGLTQAHTKQVIVAYEPVWAIGTGLSATPDIALNVHANIRSILESLFGVEHGGEIPILYGGSTNPDNIASLCSQANVDGALVGGASLKPDTFYQLILNAATI